MSWSIFVTGTVSGVKKFVQEAKPHMEVDKIAFERTRAIILDELSRVISNGVSVEANGHADRTNKIQIHDSPLML